MKFTRRSAPISERDVAEFERNLDAALPAEYRHFLLNRFGGYAPDPSLIDLPYGQQTSIAAFYSLGQERIYRLDEFPGMGLSEEMSRRLVAFAEDGVGNYFVIDLRPASWGKIYFREYPGNVNIAMEIDTRGFVEADYESGVYFHPVAGDFRSFFEKIFSDDDANDLPTVH